MSSSQRSLFRICAILQRGNDAAKAAGLAEVTGRAKPRAGAAPQYRGENPALLLARAVGASHAEALGAVLDREQLPWRAIEIRTEATCCAGIAWSSVALSSPDTVAVFPSIFGGDPGRLGEYAAAAVRARDHSLIGHAIRGNVAYKVGAVTVVASGRPDGRASGAVAGVEQGDVAPDAPDGSVRCDAAALTGRRHAQAAGRLAALLHMSARLFTKIRRHYDTGAILRLLDVTVTNLTPSPRGGLR